MSLKSSISLVKLKIYQFGFLTLIRFSSLMNKSDKIRFGALDLNATIFPVQIVNGHEQIFTLFLQERELWGFKHGCVSSSCLHFP
jgi:hypothetical protein